MVETMKPKIFKANQTEFDGNGLGYLELTPSCVVRESLNGTFELNMEILISDALFNAIEVGAIIVVQPNMTDKPQPFIIEQISKNIDGLVEVYATHIAQYRSRLIPVLPYDATDLSDAIAKAISYSAETNIFTLTTNKSVSTPYSLKEPRSFRELLGGRENSLLDIYGGEYLFDRLNISLLNRRGRPNAFNIVYGHNMIEYNQTDFFDWTNSVTAILPFAKYRNVDTDTLVVGDIQYSSYVDMFPYKKTIAYDFSDKFTEDNPPTKNTLNDLAIAYLGGKGMPLVNIKASFEDVSTLPMYSDISAKINTLQLGDSVQVINSMYNTNVTTRIRELEFDVLLERYKTITIGDATSTINDAISDIGGGSTINYYGGSGGGWYVDEYSQHQGATPINADYLNGHDSQYFIDSINQIDYVQVNGLAIHKNNKIVAIYITSNHLESDGYTLGTIPEGYRPYRESLFFSKCWNGSSYVDCRIRIQTNGIVTITTTGNGVISGIQPSFFQLKPIIYMLTA